MIQRNFKLLQVFSTRYVGFELIYKVQSGSDEKWNFRNSIS